MKIKRIYFITTINVDDKNELGILNKVLGQIKALEKLEFKVIWGRFKNGQYILDDKLVYELKKLPMRIGKFIFFRKIFKEIIENDGSAQIYIRYGLSTPFFINFLRKLKNKRYKIFLEIPTFPYDLEYKKTNALRKILFFSDCMFRGKLKKYVYKVITFSSNDAKEIYGIPCVRISNGIESSKISTHPSKPVEYFKNVITMTSVSSMNYWHGIDRLLKSIQIFENENDSVKLHINLVGEGREKNYLERLVIDLKLKSKIVFHGVCTGEDLKLIYQDTDIGIGCLGNHRKNIFMASSLKNREYASYGLPIIYSELDPDFDKERFVFKVSPDESLFDIRDIVNWYLESDFCRKDIIDWSSKFNWERQMDKIFF